MEMRQITFRGRCDESTWVYGDLEYNRARNIARIHTYDENGDYRCQHNVIPNTVGQFIGLTDCNGKEIYEGDIIEEHDLLYEVCWYDDIAAFMAEDIQSEKPFLMSDIDLSKTSVIGNIYDKQNEMNKEKTI